MNKTNTLTVNSKENQPNKIWGYLKEFIPYLGLLSLMILFATTTNGRFLRISNIGLILKQSAIVLIGTMGTTFVMAHGNLDFSLGGELAICALGGWYASQINPALMLPTCLVIGVLCSYIIAKVHVKLSVPVFTAGLCVMFIGKSVAMSLGSTSVMTSPSVFNKFDEVYFYILVSVIFIVIAYVLFEFTKVGKFNKAIGVNPNAALYSGIPVNKYKVIAFMITGFAVGMSAFLSIIRSGGVSSQTGATFEIDVLLVMVLGGIPLSGGTESLKSFMTMRNCSR